MVAQNKTFLIMGTPVAPGNRGVMALGASVVDLFRSCSSGCTVKFLQVHRPWAPVPILTSGGTYDVEVVIARMGLKSGLAACMPWIVILATVYRLFPPARTFICSRSHWIREVASASFVGDIRGGDSFSDIYGLKRFLFAAIPVLSVIIVRGSIVHLPQTYGPFSGGVARALARMLLNRSKRLIARDTASQGVAREIVRQRIPVELSPDVAFFLKRSHESDSFRTARSFSSGRRVIGLNVNGLMYNGGYSGTNLFSLKLDYIEFVDHLIHELLRKFDVDLILIPHTFAPVGNVESDNAACLVVMGKLPDELRGRVHMVEGDPDQHEIKGVISLCEFFIGSRMHACIGALSQGVPCCGVAYSMKFKGVFDSVGMGEWVVDGRSIETEAAVERVISLYGGSAGVREQLLASADAARRRLLEVFGTLA